MKYPAHYFSITLALLHRQSGKVSTMTGRCVLLLFLCATSTLTFAKVNTQTGAAALLSLDYLGDQTATHTIDSVLSKANSFRAINSRPFIANANMHWYRLHLGNSSDTEETWVISTGAASALTLNAFWVNDGKIQQVKTKTELSRYASNTNFSILLSIPKLTKGHLYIQYNGLAQFPLSIRVRSLEDFTDRRFKFTLLNGMALGAISVFVLFFAIQACVFRRKDIAFYCLFIFSIGCLATQVFGYGIRSIWPEKLLLDSHVTQLCANAIYLFYFLFTAHLFKHDKRIYLGLITLATTTGVLCLLGLFFKLNFLLTLIIAVGMPIAIFSAFLALPQQRMTALYFIAGSIVHYLFTGLLLLTLLGAPIGSMAFALSTVGQIVDIICFSVAIMLNSRHLEKALNRQVSERLSDIKQLNASETTAEQMRTINKDIIIDSSSTAHDLQQALASIRLQLAMYPDTKNTLPLLYKTIHYAGEILDQKLKRGRTDFTKINTHQDIHAILNHAAQRHHLAMPNLRVRLQSMTLWCSELAVNRIVDNLLSNAQKYSHHKKVLLTGRRKKDQYWIQVRDQGNGINPEKLKRIFEPFKAVDACDLANASHGLGLHIVKFLCDEFNFEFSIQSEKNCGTCFTVRIPKTTRQPP